MRVLVQIIGEKSVLGYATSMFDELVGQVGSMEIDTNKHFTPLGTPKRGKWISDHNAFLLID